MKKKSMFFVAALSAMALASCSQDETVAVNQGNAIAFRAFTDHATRATEVTTSNLNSFVVQALQGANASGATPVWKDTYSWQSGTSTWESTVDHFFPGEGTLHFFAYNEANLPSGTAASNVTINGTTQKITGLKPDATAGEQEDLVVAYESGSDQANTDGKVTINFKHVYSQIRVNAVNNNTDALRVHVLGVRLNGFNATTDFTFPTTSTNTTKDDVLDLNTLYSAKDNTNKDGDYYSATTWTATSAKQLGSTATSLLTLADANADTDPGFMILPQSLTAWTGENSTGVDGSYISVLCRIETKSGTGANDWHQVFPDVIENPDNQNMFAWTAIPFSGASTAGATQNTIQPGTCYTVTLDFSSGGGITDPEQPVDPEEPVVDVDPNKPVLGAQLSFTVTVSDWKDVTEDKDM